MKIKLLICLTFLCLGWIVWEVEVYSAEVGHNKPERVHISALAPAPENYVPPATTYKYPVKGIKYSGTCTDIAPQAGIKIEHTQIGDTWYDFQQNGSMGRMIAVTSDGYREDSWMYTAGEYPGVGRYIRANQETPGNSWVGAINADGGTPLNTGYCNQSRLDGPGADNGASVLIYHRIFGTPTWYTTLCVDDEAGSNSFTRKFDVPDWITGSAYQSEWSKVEVKYDADAGKDYIHIVGTEGNTMGGVPEMVTYLRCYIKDGPGLLDTLVCQCYNQGASRTYQVVAGANGGGSFSPITYFDSSCSITPVVVTSKMSSRVAVAWLRPTNCTMSLNHCDFLSDICFIESMNSGQDWVDGTNWPPPEYNTTNYGCGGTERGFEDLNACYDYQDSLHIVYVTAGFDSTEPGYYQPGMARLYHWSKKNGHSMIATKIQGGCNPGAHNINIAKMSISALDPIYHPGGTPDSVYLYTIWTQFDSADQSSNGLHGNGDLFGCGSNTGGYSWGNVFNLTNTQTPNCIPGACLSEHWSSLAQNMYNGNLHIQYICDRDAGVAINDNTSTWQDNPVMYLRITHWPVDAVPRIRYRFVEPDSWFGPPLKVAPNGYRSLVYRIYNIGGANLVFSVIGDDACIQASVPPTILPPGDSATINATVLGAGACNNTFIDGIIHLQTNDTANSDIKLPVQAVVAVDYFECPRDPATTDTLKNGVMNFYVNANSQEWMHDTSTVLGQDTTYDVFFQGGPFVATTVTGDTLVGRYYGDNDQHILAQQRLFLNSFYSDFWIEATWSASISKLYPPMDTRWWWFDILHQSVFFKNTASDDLKNCVIKFYTVYRHAPPPWWPSQPVFTGYEDTYIGLMMDIDCPYDTLNGQSARNVAGYDATNNIAWQSGWGRVTEHPAYLNYYAGIALVKGQASESETPWGTYNLCDDTHLYPNGGWGWLEQDFYNVAKGNTLGVVEFPDSLKDRSQVVTAKKISAGSDPNLEVSFTVVEAIGQTGLAQLQARVAIARNWVAGRPFHNLCGDVSGDAQITVSDVVLIISYLFKNMGTGSLATPFKGRADVNGDGLITISDVVKLLSYLFKGVTPENTFHCATVW